MSCRKLLLSIVASAAVICFVAGCGAPATPEAVLTATPTASPPRATFTLTSAPSATPEAKLPTTSPEPTDTPTGKPPTPTATPSPSATRSCMPVTVYPGNCPDAVDAVSRDVWACENVYFNSTDKIGYVRPDWMGELPDDLLLSELSIPGTHETMARHGYGHAPCQSLDLYHQLRAGIRALDIRVRSVKERWEIYHGDSAQQANFGHVLSTVVDFLTDHRDETVLMRIQPNTGYKGEHNARIFNWYMDQEYQGKKFMEWVWHGDPATGFEVPPRLGQVRRKIVILEDSWFAYEGPRRYGIDWNSLTIQDEYKMQAGFCDRNDAAGLLGFAPKFALIREHIDSAMTDTGSWYVNFTSGTQGVYPVDVANGVVISAKWCDGMNRRTYGYITSCYVDQCAPYILDRGEHGRLGTIMMDFPGSGLIDAIIAHNGLPRLVVAWSGPFPDTDRWGDYEKHYATIHSGDIDGDRRDELLGRAIVGMAAWRFNPASNSWKLVIPNGPFPDSDGWDHEKNYATIHSADIDGDGRDELLGRANAGMEVWRFDAYSSKWERVCTVPQWFLAEGLL
jgi:hypothetical protein